MNSKLLNAPGVRFPSEYWSRKIFFSSRRDGFINLSDSNSYITLDDSCFLVASKAKRLALFSITGVVLTCSFDRSAVLP